MQKRIESIDITRGLVVIIMTLDHAREFMHNGAYSPDPTNLQTTTYLLFLTRWVTHVCAPAFLFLAGTSAYLSMIRTNNYSSTRRKLLVRGILLVVLDLTLVNFALWFDIQFRLILFEVIAAIGCGFILLTLFLRLPAWITATTGVLIIFLHNLLPGSLSPGTIQGFLYSVFVSPGMTTVSPSLTVFTAYPVLPWFGIMLLGFSIGRLFESEQENRKKSLLLLGGLSLALFVLIRFINSYGDPSAWAKQESTMFTFLSFVNVTKYPPSLLFTLLFVGLMLIVLACADRLSTRVKSLVSVFGKVPFFYFVVHLFLIHVSMFVMLLLQGFGYAEFRFGLFNNGRPEAASGIPLWGVYLFWVAVLLIMYPLSLWYARLRERNQLLRYL
ncbi:MAG: heparan-alpha-glucosaminide N-acetyltransferase domain-containing protein [Bacteroidales bacterium]